MTLREDLNACTPRLRRYARALATGSAAASTLADDLVHAALMRALGSRQLGSSADVTLRLYATVTQLHREAAMMREARAAGARRLALVAGAVVPAAARQTKLSAGLLGLPLEDREALLLVALEGFDHADTARILRISRATLLGRLTRARRALDDFLKSAPLAAVPERRTPHLRVVR